MRDHLLSALRVVRMAAALAVGLTVCAVQTSSAAPAQSGGDRAADDASGATSTFCLAMDASKSMRDFAVTAEAVQVVDALPSGTRLVILAVRGHTEKLFDAVLDSKNRSAAIETVRKISPTGAQTDLGEAMAKATFEVMNSAAPRRVCILTDGRHLPDHESIYRGRSFEALLDRPDLPADILWAIRLFGNSPLHVSRSNVVIMRSASDWASLLGAPSAPADPSKRVPLPSAALSTPTQYWRAAGSLAVTVLVLIGIYWLAFERKGRKASARQAMFERMKQAPPPLALPKDPEPAPKKLQYALTDPASGSQYKLGSDEDSEVTFGGGWDVDFRVCDDLRYRVAVRTKDGELEFENAGAVEVSVGAESIAPGKTLPLPPTLLVFVLGTTRLIFSPVNDPVSGGQDLVVANRSGGANG
jgi:hypothetical protein